MKNFGYRPIILASLIPLLFFADRAEAKTMDEHIYIVPAGQIDEKIIADIKNRLPKSLPMNANVAIEEKAEIPEEAYDPSRKQYLAQMVLDHVMQKIGIDVRDDNALIITDVDLYMPDLNFVFGLADAKKKASIISLTRLKNEFYGLKPDYDLLIERAVKEAVHELGHSWGLAHCPDARCVMYFSNSLKDTDNKRSTFCRSCRDALRHRYGKPLFKASLKPLL